MKNNIVGKSRHIIVDTHGGPCHRHRRAYCTHKECIQHWHRLANGKSFELKWLRLSHTIWPNSEQYAIGLTTGNFVEVFYDKVAIWCYDTYIYDNLCQNIEDLKEISDSIEKKSFSNSYKKHLSKRAHKIINNIVFSNKSKCTGVRIDGRVVKCKSHLVIQDIPQTEIIDLYCRISVEATCHEMIHAYIFEDDEPIELDETLVEAMAQKLAGTEDIKRPRVT